MARDLSFWRTKRESDMSDSEVYDKLCNSESLDFLETLPVDEIKNTFMKEFSGWNQISDVDYEMGDSAFQLLMTKQFVRVDCYSMSENDMNKIIDIMYEFGCPLYDAAIGVRFS